MKFQVFWTKRPFMEQGGFDLIAQGMSGLMSITGEEPGRSPVKVGAPLTDITAGIWSFGCSIGLHQRNASGQGQKVDTSLFEAGIVHTYWQSAICAATGVSPGPSRFSPSLNAPYQTFAPGAVGSISELQTSETGNDFWKYLESRKWETIPGLRTITGGWTISNN